MADCKVPYPPTRVDVQEIVRFTNEIAPECELALRTEKDDALGRLRAELRILRLPRGCAVTSMQKLMIRMLNHVHAVNKSLPC